MAVARPDMRHMRHALMLAARAVGRTAPNPAVGCVIVAPDGHIAGRGWTGDGGRPHAETRALIEAGAAARGATAYVTLEPCAHYGRTPPCAEALARAGITRVVAAIADPDPRVNGKGFTMLRAAGVTVETGLCEGEAAAINAGFFLNVCEKRPLVTLKIAMSLDGKIAAASGASEWITGLEARRFAHFIRAENDAILVGIGTVLADDPELTCRLPGLEVRSPLRVVLDSKLRLPEDSRLARSARRVPVAVFSTCAGGEALAAEGVEICPVQSDRNGRSDVAAVLAELAKRGITRLLVEGGAGIHAAFLDRNLADRLELFRGPQMLGGEALSGIGPLSVETPDAAPRFRLLNRRVLGQDVLESYIRGR
jgi:diaminohydroxyphosphoribosylaminopyrimidine deaminase/5-amino-6-(5-phosphoribosylamino)uracil reductase